ncbi:MAG: hypothetical protein JWR21_1631 [Herminiimonas sp.]|nr:hypothetical protein [Herminiimonas sp.]
MATANPFKKSDKAPYREWEESLLLFLLTQLSNPDVEEWRKVAIDKESRRSAAFMAYQLSNFALCRRLPAESALRSVYKELTGIDMVLSDYRGWLDQNWISPSRLTASLDSGLRLGLCKESGLIAG